MTDPLRVVVPHGTERRQCRGATCTAAIYFVRGSRGGLMPVCCDVEGGTHPTATADGRGEPHHIACPDAARFRQRK